MKWVRICVCQRQNVQKRREEPVESQEEKLHMEWPPPIEQRQQLWPEHVTIEQTIKLFAVCVRECVVSANERVSCAGAILFSYTFYIYGLAVKISWAIRKTLVNRSLIYIYNSTD